MKTFFCFKIVFHVTIIVFLLKKHASNNNNKIHPKTINNEMGVLPP
jgi:hypothetical protein